MKVKKTQGAVVSILLDHGYTSAEIARVLGISRQAVSHLTGPLSEATMEHEKWNKARELRCKGVKLVKPKK